MAGFFFFGGGGGKRGILQYSVKKEDGRMILKERTIRSPAVGWWVFGKAQHSSTPLESPDELLRTLFKILEKLGGLKTRAMDY